MFDSSGPEGKVRGTPQQIIEKYNQLARDAQLGNDRVAAENFQQHAEHYLRLLSEAQREMDARREEQERQNRERQAQADRERAEREAAQQAEREAQQAEREARQAEREARADDGDAPAADTPKPARTRRKPKPAAANDALPVSGDDAAGADGSTLVDTPEEAAKPPRRKPRARKPAATAPESAPSEDNNGPEAAE